MISKWIQEWKFGKIQRRITTLKLWSLWTTSRITIKAKKDLHWIVQNAQHFSTSNFIWFRIWPVVIRLPDLNIGVHFVQNFHIKNAKKFWNIWRNITSPSKLFYCKSYESHLVVNVSGSLSNATTVHQLLNVNCTWNSTSKYLIEYLESSKI